MHKRAAGIFLAFCFILILAGISEAQLIKGKQPEKPVKKWVSFPEGSTIKYSMSGKPHKVILSKACEIQGIMWPEGTDLKLDESGKIMSAYVRTSVMVQGIMWPDESLLSLTQTGKINWVWLGRALNIQGKSFARSERVRLDANGKVHRITGYGGPVTGGANADF